MAGPGCVAEADLRATPRGRLCAKLLVFRNRLALRRFWNGKLGKEERLGLHCFGVVNGLSRWIESYDAKTDTWSRRMERCDPRYFCVIGLVVGHLGMEVITHEAGHAGFCYAKRVQRAPWAAARDFDEEEVCDPAGMIAAAIKRFLHRRGLYG